MDKIFQATVKFCVFAYVLLYYVKFYFNVMGQKGQN